MDNLKSELEKYKADGHTLLSIDLMIRLVELAFQHHQPEGLSSEWLKTFATKFFFYWWNEKGSNTYQGYDEWTKTDEFKQLTESLSPQQSADAVEFAEWIEKNDYWAETYQNDGTTRRPCIVWSNDSASPQHHTTTELCQLFLKSKNK